MTLHLTNPIVLTFIIYLAVMLGVGWVGYLSTRNLSDYILGGRRLGAFVTALSAGASDMSGWLLMGLPGAVYLSGISERAAARVYRARGQRPHAAGLFRQPL